LGKRWIACFQGQTLNKTTKPDEAVAYEAVASVLSGEEVCGSDLTLLDVTPHSLGIEIIGGVMSVIIERNTTIPVTMSEIYYTVDDDQTKILKKIYEGESRIAAENNFL
jgi:molecular chaperone DnaK (HSP70)